MAYRIAKIRSEIGFERASALDKLLFDGVPYEGPETGNVMWLATNDEGEAVGFASVRPTFGHPTAAFLSRAGILSGHRRKGLHTRLIKAREAYCASRFDYIWTYTRDWNIPSANSLIRRGYLLFTPYWADPGNLYFRKEL